jgi:hypothetical protein
VATHPIALALALCQRTDTADGLQPLAGLEVAENLLTALKSTRVARTRRRGPGQPVNRQWAQQADVRRGGVPDIAG